MKTSILIILFIFLFAVSNSYGQSSLVFSYDKFAGATDVSSQVIYLENMTFAMWLGFKYEGQSKPATCECLNFQFSSILDSKQYNLTNSESDIFVHFLADESQRLSVRLKYNYSEKKDNSRNERRWFFGRIDCQEWKKIGGGRKIEIRLGSLPVSSSIPTEFVLDKSVVNNLRELTEYLPK